MIDRLRDNVKVQHSKSRRYAPEVFSRGFAARRRRVGLRPTKHLVAREKKPLVPRVFISQILDYLLNGFDFYFDLF